MPPAPSSARVVDNPAESRYELWLGDDLVGRSEYRPAGASVIVSHTEVDEGHEGEGLGSLLVAATLDGIRESGRTVIPVCPFTVAYLERHPELAPVVDPSLRGRFARPGSG